MWLTMFGYAYYQYQNIDNGDKSAEPSKHQKLPRVYIGLEVCCADCYFLQHNIYFKISNIILFVIFILFHKLRDT